MSNTVLSSWDFFWIWFIVLIGGGGSAYLSSRDTAKLDALEQRIVALTEALRAKDAAPAPAPAPIPAAPAPAWLRRDEQQQ
jgi:hypothetical protein